MTFATWPLVLNELLENRSSPAHLSWAMNSIMSGEATSAQIAAFAVALRAKGESAQDISALVSVMFDHAITSNVDGITVDTCGTGGDGAHTVNISTMAAIVVASAGRVVVKHGNRAASSKCGSADVLEQLGIQLDHEPANVAKIAQQCGITFYFARVFHPALRHAGPARAEIGIRTVFNMLGPLANPAKPKAQVIGVAQPEMGPLMADVLHARGTKALVVHGHEGLDELSTHGPSDVWTVLGDRVEHFHFDPKRIGISAPSAEALTGGDAEFNAEIVQQLFENVQSPKLHDIRNAVALNAAAAMVAADSVEGDVGEITTALQKRFHDAVSLIEDGSALRKLEEWIRVSKSIWN